MTFAVEGQIIKEIFANEFGFIYQICEKVTKSDKTVVDKYWKISSRNILKINENYKIKGFITERKDKYATDRNAKPIFTATFNVTHHELLTT